MLITSCMWHVVGWLSKLVDHRDFFSFGTFPVCKKVKKSDMNHLGQISSENTLKGRILVVYDSLEWWLCYVKQDRQGYCDTVILRTDLAADQLSYFGSAWEVQLGEDISDYVAGLDNTLESAVGYFGTDTMDRNPYCDLRVAVGDPSIPLYMSGVALKRCKNLSHHLRRCSFYKQLGDRYNTSCFNTKEQMRRCHKVLSSRPKWSLGYLLDLPDRLPSLPPFNLTVFDEFSLMAKLPFFVCIRKKWVEVRKIVFPTDGDLVQLCAVLMDGGSYFARYSNVDELLSACETSRDRDELVFSTEKYPRSLLEQRDTAVVHSPSTVSAASLLCNFAQPPSVPVGCKKVLGKRKQKGIISRPPCTCDEIGVCRAHNILML